MTPEPVSRAEYLELVRRLDLFDTVGTRGVAVLSVQMQEVAKDVARLEKQMESHQQEHHDAENARVTGRRWLAAAIIAAVAAIDGPIVTLVLAVKH